MGYDQVGFCGGLSDQSVGAFLPLFILERAGNEVWLVNGQCSRSRVFMGCYTLLVVILYGSFKPGEHEAEHLLSKSRD